MRRELHHRGLRFRVDWPLPGMPRRRTDVAFTRRKVAVFVDGCFWHSCPEHATAPVSNASWWQTKLANNLQRDMATNDYLRSLGWTVLRFWEHEDAVSCADCVSRALAEVSDNSSCGVRVTGAVPETDVLPQYD